MQCALRQRCLRNPEAGNPRQVRVFHGRVTETLTSRMKEKIDTAEGRAIYSRRLGTVEPVFANIGAQKGMNRSTLPPFPTVSLGKMNPVKNLLALGDPWTAEFGFEKDFAAYQIYGFEWIDRLEHFLDAEEALASWPLRDVFFAHFKKRFAESPFWVDDGKMQLLWLPPFVGEGVGTRGFYILHVKQSEDGLSWIASRHRIAALEPK